MNLSELMTFMRDREWLAGELAVLLCVEAQAVAKTLSAEARRGSVKIEKLPQGFTSYRVLFGDELEQNKRRIVRQKTAFKRAKEFADRFEGEQFEVKHVAKVLGLAINSSHLVVAAGGEGGLFQRVPTPTRKVFELVEGAV